MKKTIKDLCDKHKRTTGLSNTSSHDLCPPTYHRRAILVHSSRPLGGQQDVHALVLRVGHLADYLESLQVTGAELGVVGNVLTFSPTQVSNLQP